MHDVLCSPVILTLCFISSVCEKHSCVSCTINGRLTSVDFPSALKSAESDGSLIFGPTLLLHY